MGGLSGEGAEGRFEYLFGFLLELEWLPLKISMESLRKEYTSFIFLSYSSRILRYFNSGFYFNW